MEHVLVVCYSYTGVSRRAAQLLCSHRGWPLGEISDVHARGSWRCVLDSLLRRQPEISYMGPEPASFDTVVLVAPIWMYRLAGPMRTFVAREKDVLRHVAVVCTMNSGGASNAFAEIAHLLGPGAVIRAAAFTSREIEDGSGTSRLLELGEALQPGATARTGAQQPAWTAPAA
jgi:hypothetical protein